MAWIQSHQEIGRDPRTKRAARLLQTSVPAIVGHLHLLYHWCLDFAPDGVLEPFEAEEIADAALFEGSAAEFVDALTTCNFFCFEEGALSVANWDEVGGKLIEQRRAAVERARRSRQKSEHHTAPKPNERAPEFATEPEPCENVAERDFTDEMQRARSVRATCANVAKQSREDKSREDKTPPPRARSREETNLPDENDADDFPLSRIALLEVTKRGTRSRDQNELETTLAFFDELKLPDAAAAAQVRERFSPPVWKRETKPFLSQIADEWEAQGEGAARRRDELNRNARGSSPPDGETPETETPDERRERIRRMAYPEVYGRSAFGGGVINAH